MSQHQPDPGLFGPASVTWRLHADPVMLLAGLRALLLQALHPAALAGVLGHSDFRGDPWGRLLRTAEYVGTVSYGTREQAQRAAARVGGIHRRVVGVDHHTGRRYRADDPDLLRWVHCCEVESFLSTYRRCGGPLFDGEADRYVREQTTSAALSASIPTACPPPSPHSRPTSPRSDRRFEPRRRRGASCGSSPFHRCRRSSRRPRRPGRHGPRSPAWRSRCCPGGRVGSTGCRDCR